MKKQLQAFYDKTMKHLIKQGPAMDSAGVCLYRTKTGRKCAAGLHIPDALYHPWMESNTISNLLENYPEIRKYFPSVELAEDLQRLHDDLDFWSGDKFTGRGVITARSIAEKYFLKPYPRPKEEVEAWNRGWELALVVTPKMHDMRRYCLGSYGIDEAQLYLSLRQEAA